MMLTPKSCETCSMLHRTRCKKYSLETLDQKAAATHGQLNMPASCTAQHPAHHSKSGERVSRTQNQMSWEASDTWQPITRAQVDVVSKSRTLGPTAPVT
jgi:hypothetical protein